MSASYEGDLYIRGREYDVVAIDSGHYYLTEVKLRVPGFRVKHPIGMLIQAGMAVNAARQIIFDMNIDSVTLTGKGIPGGEVTLEAGEYTVNWAIVRPNGKGWLFNTTNAKEIDNIVQEVFQ